MTISFLLQFSFSLPFFSLVFSSFTSIVGLFPHFLSLMVCFSCISKVCEAFTECKGQHETWWLDALDLIEQDKELSNELIRRIDEAVSESVNNSKSRIATRLDIILFVSLILLLYHSCMYLHLPMLVILYV